MMIPLTKGYIALVDQEDFYALSQLTWRTHFSHGMPYARSFRWDAGKTVDVLMHREVMGLKRNDGKIVDHKNNHDTLDNRKSNLRVATQSQNLCNRTMKKTSKSGIKGVYQYCNKWRAQITFNGNVQYLGLFSNKEEAGEAYWHRAKELHGEFANRGELK